MAENTITLKNAPEHFFDKEEWQKYSANFPNCDKALIHLAPEPGALTYMRHQVIEVNNHHSADARRAEEIYQQGQGIVAAFRARLVSGEISAIGLQPPSIERKQIPVELWNDLIPDFVANKAKANAFEFLHINLSEATVAQNPVPDIIKQCTEWMQQYRDQYGEQPKKVLQDKVFEHFGKSLTTREFDAAYKAVFKRTRGRPRSPTKK